ncbi:rhodanese-like domain-containing protein [Stenomitos frigidus]|uniref:Rhodanese-like domain-containing protein n=1 Tax=Stenomitos frigidus ULC18 TaxID=2107698 RepID=A0A2T1E1U3_9CYAN|nr:rhodanese-like domain-containing protein [Stenomitos frigidus]PSB26709.1 rhodanese-like domain-containing protein [Stenomitos frigidus ULC18]
MENIQNAIKDAKDALPDIIPTPPGLKAESSAHDLKSRLEWGEPALTILDVRDRESFNRGHIMGAMPMPLDRLVDSAKSIDQVRDIYVYGATNEETNQAATKLREAGFRNVATLKGGLEGWKAIEGSTEGPDEVLPPGADAYNVVSRLAHHQQTQKK